MNEKLRELGKAPAKPQDVFADLRKTAQDRIKDQLYADAKKARGTNELLFALAKKIADECDCHLSMGPIKTLESAKDKLERDYSKYVPEGDWYEMKDICRCTIIAPNLGKLDRVGKTIRATCVASSGMGLPKDEEAIAHTDKCGYSGFNFVVRLTNGRLGEIQANIPEVMYGKMSNLRFRQQFGNSRYFQFLHRFKIDGGMGHGLYEIFRADEAGVKGRHAAVVSKLYYNYLRWPGIFQNYQELKRLLAPIVKANPGRFNVFRVD
jgi:hypothetical protein